MAYAGLNPSAPAGLGLEQRASPLEPQQLHALETALSGLSPTQTAWVSGYLAGLAAVGAPVTGAAVAANQQPALTVTILYGSQTGNGRAVAERLGEQALAAGINAAVVSMGDYSPRRLAKEQRVLLVVSTHGEGEPPEAADALHRFLQAERAPQLPRLQYAVLGLGDSSYEHFCQAAVEFDRRLADLGAERLLALQCCDLEFQASAGAWSTRVLERVADDAPAVGRADNVVALPGTRLARPRAFTRDHPYTATLLENRRITTPDAVADVRHLVLGIDPQQLRFAPGDALGVRFHNAPALVEAVLEQTGLDGAATVSVGDGSEVTLSEALAGHLELTQLHPTTVRGWAGLRGNAALRDLAADPPRLRALAASHQFIDLLVGWSAASTGDAAPLDAATLVSLLPSLQPRLYSIASSQAKTDDEVHLTVSVVRWSGHGRDHLGGASGYLAERAELDAPVSVYVVENPGFHLPTDGATPIIMIGAGTGMAPYRAFLQQRAANGDTGRNWLIFGNRHFHRDFLYQLDWQAQRKAGRLERVSLAFSRDGDAKCYVQHRLREEASELWRWLEAGAHVYVCGATAMGQQVQQALVEAVATGAGIGADAAAHYVDALRGDARYHRDLY